MAVIDHDLAPASQPWLSRRVVTFAGQFDSLLRIEIAPGEQLTAQQREQRKNEARQRAAESGKVYRTIALADLWSITPTRFPKGAGPAIVPSTYDNWDAREHDAQREHGRFVLLCGDVDSGDHQLDAIKKAVAAFAPRTAALIYSSAHARPGDMRWRILIPLADEQPFDTWHDAQTAFFAFMEASGIAMDHALARAAQPVYLPNVPDIHGKSSTPLRGEDGKALFYRVSKTPQDKPGLDLTSGPVSEGIAAIRAKRVEDERERERIRREAEQRRANTPRGDGASLMDDFNAANSVAVMLELCGYQQSPRHGEDWRSPYQTSESHATRIIGSKWVSLSASDASAGLGTRCQSGCYGDAYDLYVHFKHGGDHKAAYRTLGAERRADNVIYPRQFETPPVPDWMAETPDYDDYPEWGDPDGEPVIDADFGIEAEQEQPRALPFEWAGKAEPVIDGLWLIDDWLPKSGIAAIYGHPGCGKSFLAIDMAAHIASGEPWAGRHVEQGLVVYVVAEGQTGFRNRLFAMQRAGKIAPDAPFVFIPCPIDMQAPDGDLKALMETIAQVTEQARQPLALLVIDTLSKTFGAGKENTDDMAGYIANCQRVSSAFDCLTAIVHHRPKDSESRDLRGHSSLRGGIETAILVEAGDIKTATTLKQKDGEDNMAVRFKLERVVIGEDKRGKEVSTCLTEIVEGDAPVQFAHPIDARKARLTGHKRMALRAIEEVISIAGREPPAEIPGDAIDRYRTWKAVPADMVRDRLRNEFKALGDNEGDKNGGNAKRYTFRVLKDLKSAEILGSWGDWFWIN